MPYQPPSIPRRAGVLLLSLLVVAGSAPAAAAQDVFTPWHVAQLKTVGAATPSPDGSRIAYILSIPRDPLEEPDGPAWEELHVVEAATGADTGFVTGEVNVGAPQWDPKGQGIYFLAKRGSDKTRGLYFIPAAGGEARRVVSYETDIRAFEVAPDGKRVAFVATPPKSEDLQKLEKKGFTQEIYEEDERNAQVLIAPVQGDGQPRALELPGHASRVDWSPDGTRMAVVLAPSPLVDDDLMHRRVHIVDPASGKVLENLENPGKLETVEWSPDSRSIGIVSGEDLNDPAAGRLLVRQIGGGTWKDVLPRYEAHVRDFVWRDARTLVYIGDEDVETVLGEVQVDGTNRKVLVPRGVQILNAIEAVDASGTFAIQAESPRHPAEVFTLAGASELKRLTDSNPWLATMRFAPQEVVTFTARDGLQLQGILIRPLDEQPGRRYPLILTVHGGPESHDRNGWRTAYSLPGQVGAAQGFAVFYPNYRGSTGRGIAFSKLGQGDPAGKEFDDLVDAVDHLVAAGLVDTSKVGITGGSYGGYATAWASTYHTKRFAAGVMFVGISNKISKVGTTDIANEEFLVHARKRPWDDWNFFLERSPIYHAGQSQTPLLIMHGKADPRVHPTQSLELYRYLKLHGKAPVRLVWYPGEQHGNRRAASRLDYNLRMMRWFNHYLQGPGGEPPDPNLPYTKPDAAALTATK